MGIVAAISVPDEIREAVALLPLEEVENHRMHPRRVAGTAIRRSDCLSR